MFKNIGRKIKGLAAVICWIGIVISVIGGIVLVIAAFSSFKWDSKGAGFGMVLVILAGMLTAGIGILFSWLGSFMLYGYGELIDRTTRIEEKLNKVYPDQQQ